MTSIVVVTLSSGCANAKQALTGLQSGTITNQSQLEQFAPASDVQVDDSGMTSARFELRGNPTRRRESATDAVIFPFLAPMAGGLLMLYACPPLGIPLMAIGAPIAAAGMPFLFVSHIVDGISAQLDSTPCPLLVQLTPSGEIIRWKLESSNDWVSASPAQAPAPTAMPIP